MFLLWKKRRIFESFEKISQTLSICVKCSTLLYKLRDCKSVNNNEMEKQIIEKIRQAADTKASLDFKSWLKNKYSIEIDDMKDKDSTLSD